MHYTSGPLARAWCVHDCVSSALSCTWSDALLRCWSRGAEVIEVAQGVEHSLRRELQRPQPDRLVALIIRVLNVIRERRVNLLRRSVEQADVLSDQRSPWRPRRTQAVQLPLNESSGRSTRHLTGTSVRLQGQRRAGLPTHLALMNATIGRIKAFET